MSSDVQLLVQIYTVFAGSLAGLYQWWNGKFRSELKADFEILRSLQELSHDDANYLIVKAHIDATISKAYACGRNTKMNGVSAGKFFHLNWVDVMCFLVFLGGAVLWSVELFDGGISWRRVLLTAGFAFSTLMAVFRILHKRRVAKTAIAACSIETQRP